MQRKKVIGIAIILIVGIVSAGLIDYYGQVNQTLNVDGLVFYLDGVNIYNNNYNLTKNIIPKNEEDFNLTEEVELKFISEVLEINELDNPSFDIYIWSKKNNESDVLRLNIIKIKQDLTKEIICVPLDIDVDSGNFNKDIRNCESGKIIFEAGDKIGLSVNGSGNIRVGHKYSDGYSRIEISRT